MSMYSRAEHEVFSARCPLATYCICFLIGHSTAVSIQKHENNMLSFNVMSPEEQLALLDKIGFDWLDKIQNQMQLRNALFDLDSAINGTILWNDIWKLAPFLVTEDYQSADKVVSSILYQHAGSQSFPVPPWSPEDYDIYCRLYPNKDEKFICMHRWIANQEKEKIREYLLDNYNKNITMGNFITHNKTGDGKT